VIINIRKTASKQKYKKKLNIYTCAAALYVAENKLQKIARQSATTTKSQIALLCIHGEKVVTCEEKDEQV